MVFVEFRFAPIEDEAGMAVLMAELLGLGFESFSEEDDTLVAYLPGSIYRQDFLEDVDFLKDHPGIKIRVNPLEDKNWNEEWEKNYPPVTIAGKCYVRAPFHPSIPGIPYEILIEPKMAFGTAHHETTRLVAEWLMELDVKNKEVLDMGCGTGILAILANKMGAGHVIGIDNDKWATRNATENFQVNQVRNGKVLYGDAGLIEAGRFHLVLANINRNILLNDMKAYAKGLVHEGLILFSGFYEADRDAITGAAVDAGLRPEGIRTLNQWAVMLFSKVSA